jgi:hypothetical protein
MHMTERIQIMIAPLVSSNSDMLDCAQKISTPFGSNFEEIKHLRSRAPRQYFTRL